MQNIQRSSRLLRCAHIHHPLLWNGHKLNIFKGCLKIFYLFKFWKKVNSNLFFDSFGMKWIIFFVMVACFEFENNIIVLRIIMNKKWINKNHSTINFWQMNSFFSHITFNTYCQFHDKRYIFFFLNCVISFYNTIFGFILKFWFQPYKFCQKLLILAFSGLIIKSTGYES